MEVDDGKPEVLVIGGYGVFGSHVSRELNRLGVPFTVAGRSIAAAKTMAARLGPGVTATDVDVTNPVSCKTAIRGHQVVAVCAGPFQHFGDTILEASLEEHAHYVDICDDRRYVDRVRQFGPSFSAQQRGAYFGCSSLPGISAAAALRARRLLQSEPVRARVTLFIGNANPKGRGAVASAISLLGRPIDGPGGRRKGFSDGVPVDLPVPFGRRRVLNFESPDFEVLPRCLTVKTVDVKVGFESRLATGSFEMFARTFPGAGRWLLPKLNPLAALLPGGHSGGVVMAELFGESDWSRVAVFGSEAGQRMAALPCVYAIQRLLHGNRNRSGWGTLIDLMDENEILAELQNDGFRIEEHSSHRR